MLKGNTEEKTILKAFGKGREEAFEYIFRCYYRPLTLFAAKYVGDVEEAKEITQEFFIRFWAKNPTLNPGALKSYLYRGIRNACVNHIQAQKVAERRFKDYAGPTITHDNALNNMMLAEQEEELMQAIDNLPFRCRQIFVMSRMEKLPYKDIAEKLNISVKTVENQMTIALRKLKELMLILPGIVALFEKIFF